MLRRTLACLFLTTLAAGCGGGSAARPGAWTPSGEVKPFDGDARIVPSRDHAEAVIKHQREDHCGQRLVEVRCEDRTSSWECRYRTAPAAGSTSIPKRAAQELSVACP